MDILVFLACFAMIALASKQIGQGLVKTGLPLISGFLLTGILAGPFVLDLITREAVQNLGFVDAVALGFIAYAAGSELYLKEVKSRFRSIVLITVGLVASTFTLCGLTVFFLSAFIPFMKTMPVPAKVAVSILAGAILVARSPSSAIAVVNELRAKGPFTQTVLGVTIIMDVVVILLFALNSSIADALLTGMQISLGFALLLMAEIGSAILAGYLLSRGIIIVLDLPVPKAVKTVLILATGYLVFFMSAVIRSASHDRFGIEILVEPLLVCMIAGFLVANQTDLRREFTKILQDIGPPVYVAFFTLTGASLSLDVLARTWPIAVSLFFVRIFAIFWGSFIGGTLAKNPIRANTVSWMAYITQAGVGLGLAKEVVVEFPEWGLSLATIIISVIVLNQLFGPPLFKLAIKLMKEDHARAEGDGSGRNREAVVFGSGGDASALALSLSSRGWQVCLAVPDTENRPEPSGNMSVRVFSDLSLESLERVNCRKAAAIVTMLSDEENFKICEAAYEHFGTQTLVARLNDRNNFGCFEALGVLIVDPSTAIVSLLDHFVRSPAAAALFMGMHRDRHIMDLRIKNPDLSGLALRDLRLPLDTIIMSVRRRGVLFIPHGFTRLEAGDLVTVLGSPDSLKALALRFDVNAEAALLNLVETALPPELTGSRTLPGSGFGNASDEKEALLSGSASLAGRFRHLIEKARVMDLKQAMDKDGFFELAAASLAGPLGMVPADLVDMLKSREAESTTVLAPGLAVPHVIIEGQRRFAILLVRCRKGIRFDSVSPPVFAAFVLVGTRDERKLHLQVLAAIARIVLDHGFEKKWMRARTPRALKKIILDSSPQLSVKGE